MLYADTSLLVAALTREMNTAAAQAWVGANRLATSAWVHTELTSAIALKQRSGALSSDAAVRVLRGWDRLRAGLHPLTILPIHFERAASLITDAKTSLRAGDALHAAIAADAGHPLATLDRDLLRACATLGIPALYPLEG